MNAAVALYLATYFDANESGAAYQHKHYNEAYFRKFLMAFEQSGASILDNKFQKKIRRHFELYHLICCEAELGDAKKMRKILQQKKLFSIPWLLAGDILLCHYPDKYDSPEFQNKVRIAQLKRQKKMEMS